MFTLLFSAAGCCSCSTVESRFAQWQLAASAASTRNKQVATVLSTDELRITRFAGDVFEELGSTSQGVRAAKAQRLLLNGQCANMNSRVRSGDVVELLPAAEQAVAITDDTVRQIRFTEGLIKSGTLQVVHEDEMLAIVNKPAGIHSKPYGGPLSLEHALPGVLWPPHGAIDALVRPTCVHRLDARVSGLIVVAKSRYAAAFLAKAFRERRVRKRYRALVLGRVDIAEMLRCSGGMGAHELRVEQEPSAVTNSPPEVRIMSLMDGKQATTTLRVLESTRHVQAGWMTTLDLRLLTGRRHQLRRHCADLGFPICGDDLYVADTFEFAGKRSAGLFLQSVEVEVPHPAEDGRWVHAELPEAPKFRRQRARASLGWAFEQTRVGEQKDS